MCNLIVKDNALIEASHRLGEVEQRLILLAILKARAECNSIEQLKGRELIIHADDYIKTFNVNKSTAYRVLKKAVVGLFRAEWGYKFINSKGLPQVAYRRFIQSADYVDAGATVHFKFADDTVPMLVQLERRFTSYEVEQVSQLSSQYAMRLYEFFVQYLNKKSGVGKLDISLEELRFRFGLLPSEYSLMSNFKKFVLDLSLKQINENTNLSVTYEQKKHGRTITGFVFSYKDKLFKKSDVKKKDDKKDDVFSGLTAEQSEIIKEKVRIYAERQNITSPFHLENLYKKAVRERWYLESVQDTNAEQQKKTDVRAEKAKEKAILEQAKQDYERILSDEQLIEQYIAINVHKHELTRGVKAIYHKNSDLRALFETERYRFEQVNQYRVLNLDFLQK